MGVHVQTSIWSKMVLIQHQLHPVTIRFFLNDRCAVCLTNLCWIALKFVWLNENIRYSSLLCAYSSMIACMLSILKGYANSPPHCHNLNTLATITSWLFILITEWDSEFCHYTVFILKMST
jgi:hypothetical protein